LDFGHGGGRVLFYDLDDGKHFSSYQKWNYFSPEDDGFRKEFIPSEFYDILCSLVKSLVKKHSVKPNEVVGISTGCMRHSFVFLDKNGKELYGGPNTDTRGLFYQDVIEEELDCDLYGLTGQWPPLMYIPTRLLWFKEEKPEIFKKIKYAICTGDWLVYRLSGELVTEPSLASSTLLFDLKKQTWLYDIMSNIGLDSISLPEIRTSGKIVGNLKSDAAKKMDLNDDIPIVLGGGDTQLGLLSCGAINSGETGVVAGTSTPVMKVLSEPVVDYKKRIWTGCHVLKHKFVLESNAQMGGLVYEWLKNNFQKFLDESDDNVYTMMEKMAKNVPVGSNGVVSSLGTEIFDISNLSVIRPAIFSFQQPVHPMNESPTSFADFIRSCLENICFAIRGNITQLEEVADNKSNNLRVTGGMSKNSLWLNILSHVTGKNVLSTSFYEGTALGCVICGSVGINEYKSFDEAVKNISRFKEIVKIDKEVVESYNGLYNNWKSLYEKLAEI
jgi:sugar (pentulose or hexulose) kinase